MQVKNELHEQNQQLERERAEKHRLEYEERQQAIEEFKRSVQNNDEATQMELFLSQAVVCTQIRDVENLWKRFYWDDNTDSLIGKRISEAAQVERMYGSDLKSINKLIDDIRKMI